MHKWYAILILIYVLLAISLLACGTSDDEDNDGTTSGDDNDDNVSGGTGQIVYSFNGEIYRINADNGASPVNLSSALDALSSGSDDWVNISPDGIWLLLETERWSCGGCLAVVKTDLSKGEPIESPTLGVLYSSGYGAISSGGNRIVYPESTAQGIGLFTTVKSGSTWEDPILITGDSDYDYNSHPAFSSDGSTVVFDCGDLPYADEGTAICEIGVNGNGFKVLIKPEDGPGGSATNALHSPDYAPNGSVVFESDWGNNERTWRLPSAGGSPSAISDQFSNDNTPCVLPNGNIASLWLGRPGSAGHELKVMTPSGDHFMLIQGIDISDFGIGCGDI